jgi:anaerobic ribonucleoside-triphosphate reductase
MLELPTVVKRFLIKEGFLSDLSAVIREIRSVEYSEELENFKKVIEKEIDVELTKGISANLTHKDHSTNVNKITIEYDAPEDRSAIVIWRLKEDYSEYVENIIIVEDRFGDTESEKELEIRGS